MHLSQSTITSYRTSLAWRNHFQLHWCSAVHFPPPASSSIGCTPSIASWVWTYQRWRDSSASTFMTTSSSKQLYMNRSTTSTSWLQITRVINVLHVASDYRLKIFSEYTRSHAQARPHATNDSSIPRRAFCKMKMTTTSASCVASKTLREASSSSIWAHISPVIGKQLDFISSMSPVIFSPQSFAVKLFALRWCPTMSNVICPMNNLPMKLFIQTAFAAWIQNVRMSGCQVSTIRVMHIIPATPRNAWTWHSVQLIAWTNTVKYAQIGIPRQASMRSMHFRISVSSKPCSHCA